MREHDRPDRLPEGPGPVERAEAQADLGELRRGERGRDRGEDEDEPEQGDGPDVLDRGGEKALAERHERVQGRDPTKDSEEDRRHDRDVREVPPRDHQEDDLLVERDPRSRDEGEELHGPPSPLVLALHEAPDVLRQRFPGVEGDERGAVTLRREGDGGGEILGDVALGEPAEVEDGAGPDQDVVAVAHDRPEVPRELPLPLVVAQDVRGREGPGELHVRVPDVDHPLEDREVRVLGVLREPEGVAHPIPREEGVRVEEDEVLVLGAVDAQPAVDRPRLEAPPALPAEDRGSDLPRHAVHHRPLSGVRGVVEDEHVHGVVLADGAEAVRDDVVHRRVEDRDRRLTDESVQGGEPERREDEGQDPLREHEGEAEQEDDHERELGEGDAVEPVHRRRTEDQEGADPNPANEGEEPSAEPPLPLLSYRSSRHGNARTRRRIGLSGLLDSRRNSLRHTDLGPRGERRAGDRG